MEEEENDFINQHAATNPNGEVVVSYYCCLWSPTLSYIQIYSPATIVFVFLKGFHECVIVHVTSVWNKEEVRFILHDHKLFQHVNLRSVWSSWPVRCAQHKHYLPSVTVWLNHVGVWNIAFSFNSTWQHSDVNLYSNTLICYSEETVEGTMRGNCNSSNRNQETKLRSGFLYATHSLLLLDFSKHINVSKYTYFRNSIKLITSLLQL